MGSRERDVPALSNAVSRERVPGNTHRAGLSADSHACQDRTSPGGGGAVRLRNVSIFVARTTSQKRDPSFPTTLIF